MTLSAVGFDAAALQAEKAPEARPAGGSPGQEGAHPSKPAYDTVEISQEARAKAEEMDRKEPAGQATEKGGDDSKRFTINHGSKGKSSDADKEKAVSELKDTESDIKKKKDELQEAKTAFFGSEEEQARKIKELKQDIDDLEDTKKELESTLSI